MKKKTIFILWDKPASVVEGLQQFQSFVFDTGLGKNTSHKRRKTIKR